jgi:hypothetical protein
MFWARKIQPEEKFMRNFAFVLAAIAAVAFSVCAIPSAQAHHHHHSPPSSLVI